MHNGKPMVTLSNTLPVFCVSWVLVNLLNAHFLLGRLQRPLDPQRYEAEIIAAEDYQALSGEANGHVTLSNATTVAKTGSSESRVPSMYKAVNDGSQHVLITLKGGGDPRSEFRIVVWPIFLVSVLALIQPFVAWCFRMRDLFTDNRQV